jgi:hypothetical protein
VAGIWDQLIVKLLKSYAAAKTVEVPVKWLIESSIHKLEPDAWLCWRHVQRVSPIVPHRPDTT